MHDLRISALLLALGSTLLCATAAAQTIWYVDIQAPPPGDGSQGSPYASLSFALAQATTLAGDTLLVAPGSYPGHVAISKGVTVRSVDGPTSTRIRWMQTGGSYAVSLNHAQATLEGFTVQGTVPLAGQGTAGVLLGQGTLGRCIVTGFVGGHGVDVGNATMDHCTVTGNQVGIESVFAPFGGANLELTNSIVAGNSSADFNSPIIRGSVNYCAGLDLDPTWLNHGVGNLPVDPQTLFASWGDAHLTVGSPCIDAASPASPPDPDGSPADIGALPFDGTYAPGPQVYCTGKLHSQGCVADIGFQGQPSLSSGLPFLITAAEAPAQQIGLLFYGFGQRAAPLWGGFHCVQPPTPRTTGQFSGGAAACSGNYALDFNAWLQTHGDVEFVPGTAIFAQYWFRDPNDPLGFAVGFTDALSFLIAP